MYSNEQIEIIELMSQPINIMDYELLLDNDDIQILEEVENE